MRPTCSEGLLEHRNMTVPRVYGHAAGWWVGSHLAQPIKTAAGYASGCEKTGGPRCPIITVEGGASSDWVDVGKQMDVLQVGSNNRPPIAVVSASVHCELPRVGGSGGRGTCTPRHTTTARSPCATTSSPSGSSSLPSPPAPSRPSKPSTAAAAPEMRRPVPAICGRALEPSRCCSTPRRAPPAGSEDRPRISRS